MTTRDLSFQKNNPPAGPGGLPAGPETQPKPSKNEDGFANAMERAMRHRPVRADRTPASRATARSRDVSGEEPGPAKKIPVNFAPQTDTPPQTAQPQPAANSLEQEHNDSSAHTGSDDIEHLEPADEVAAVTEDTSSETGVPANVMPQNIVPFPMPSVIIPFPIAEAQLAAAKRSGEAGDIASAGGDATNSTGSTQGLSEAGPGEGAVESGKIIPLPIPADQMASSKAFSSSIGNIRRTVRVTDAESAAEAIKLLRLGLKAVEEMEEAEAAQPVATDEAGGFTVKAEQNQSDSSIIKVLFRPPEESRNAESLRAAPGVQTQLPGTGVRSEKNSQPDGVEAHPPETVELHPAAAKAPASASSRAPLPPVVVPSEATGTSAAKQEVSMESLTNSDMGSAFAGREGDALPEPPVPAAEISRVERETTDFSARIPGATDWQTGRPVDGSDRSAPDSSRIDATVAVERVSKLILNEAALVKQYGSDSMAVVLRPDADTELYVHFAQRNGQIEATVRCERGDAQLLGASWVQLQESLAQQKIRLAPLQESPSNHSNFNQGAGSDAGAHGNGSNRQAPPDKQSMDEWPVPASSSSTGPAHSRGHGGSRHRRLTTSRPGWETWA